MDATDKNDLSQWKHHLQDESDAAYLYRCLAEMERDEKRREIYQRLANIEDRHVHAWQKLLRAAGEETEGVKPSLRARALRWLAARFGTSLIAPILLAEEAREVKNYLKLAREMTEPQAREMATSIARLRAPC